jgi:glycerate kinase
VLQPLADGGPGTALIVSAAGGGILKTTANVRGPLGEPIHASYALLAVGPDGPRTAVIEAAATAGLVLVPPHQRDPARASTFGVGEQLAAALAAGARAVIVGVGGTGTNDGGAGAAQALGYRLLDAHGEPIAPGPRALARLDRIEPGGSARLLAGVHVRVAVDVRNPLLGPIGATAVYGPQKGVTPDLASELERALEHWARIIERDLGVAIADLEGGGAGGGLAAGLVAACGATIESGAALVGDAVGLPAAIEGTDLVVTGEGRLDDQTAFGKTVAYVAEQSRHFGKPCIVVAGRIESVPAAVLDAEPAAGSGESDADAMFEAAPRVAAAARRLIERHRARA